MVVFQIHINGVDAFPAPGNPIVAGDAHRKTFDPLLQHVKKQTRLIKFPWMLRRVQEGKYPAYPINLLNRQLFRIAGLRKQA